MIRIVSFLIVAAVTVLACGPTPLELPSGTPGVPSVGASPSISVVPQASASAPPSSAPSATPGAPIMEWTQVLSAAELGSAQMLGVVAYKDGMIAWGRGDAGTAIWTSTDGRAWSRVPAQPALAAVDLGIDSIAVARGRFVAVGSDMGRGVALVSDDGRSWTRSPDQPAFKPAAGQAIRIHAVTAGPDGFVAVGGSNKVSGGYLQAIAPLAWTSADGVVWSRGPKISSAAGIVLNGVTSGPSGFVAVGAPYNPPLTSEIFKSTDGRSWTRVPNPPSSKNAMIQDVAFTSAGFVAGGTRFIGGDPSPAVWTSSDGETWQVKALPGDGGQVFHVAPIGDGFAATGPSTETTGAWFSDDGRSWVADTPFGLTPYAAAANDSLIVVVGLEGIWIRSKA